MFIRSLGISVHEVLAVRQKSQKLSRSETLPGKRQAMPTIAMGIVGSIPSGRLALSMLGTSLVPLIDPFIFSGKCESKAQEEN